MSQSKATIMLPIINKQFLCIVDYKNIELAAIISSYLSTKDVYLPIFEFPSATAEDDEIDTELVDENTPSRIRAKEFATFVNNIIARNGGCENLILAGLTDFQKSYLNFLQKSNVIEIEKADDIDFYLSPFIDAKETLICHPNEISHGLHLALRNNLFLKLDEGANLLEQLPFSDNGLLIIENELTVCTVIAVNYAHAINADILLVNPISEVDHATVLENIENWQKGNNAAYVEIEQMVNNRIDLINIEDFKFATFFTRGLPYSLIIKNCIPCSYVHSHLRTGFFIANNLLFESRYQTGGAVIFSPEFFKNEETKLTSKSFSENKYFVKELFGSNANILNLDMHLKEFPYDLFHICSHGGEIEGHTIKQIFIDRDGGEHTIVYDEVLSFSPSPRKDLIAVQTKSYFKSFDNLKWKSKELKEKVIPQYVFADMQNAMRTAKADQKEVSPKKKIPNSCAIQCNNGNYLGMISSLASMTSPVIFNNTCWSWYQIAEPFLVSGARGYLGTLWNIDNKSAVSFATKFYENVYSESILTAIANASDSLSGTKDENIYIYWGLHFSKINIPKSAEASRYSIFKNLMRSYYMWKNILSIAKNSNSHEMVVDSINWISREISITFTPYDFYELRKEIISQVKKIKEK